MATSDSDRSENLEETRSPNVAPQIEPQLFQSGQQIGRCVIQKPLGKGATADVYLAEDQELQWTVAVKICRTTKFSCQEATRVFLNEAATVVKLKHPAIVPVHHLDRLEDGRPYVVMDYVDGPSLDKLLASEKLPSNRVIEIMVRVARALHYAHKQGFVHRDIKPANILLDKEGRPYVTDFGFAVHEDMQRLLTGDVSGTPAFMAPEQVRGEADRLDGRTDIWAMGVILYVMLTGRRPFQGATWAELSDEILRRDPKPLRMIDDRIPAELERICLKCLSKTITDRYPTAADLAAALRSAGEHEAGRSARKPLHKIAARFSVGNLGCGVMVVSFGLLIAVGIMSFQTRKQLTGTVRSYELARAADELRAHTLADGMVLAEQRAKEAEQQAKEEVERANAEVRKAATAKVAAERQAAELKSDVVQLRGSASERVEEARKKMFLAEQRAKEEIGRATLFAEQRKEEVERATDEARKAVDAKVAAERRAANLEKEMVQLRTWASQRADRAEASEATGLAMMYQSRGDYTRAEPLYKRALEVEKKSLGENHPAYAASLNNLAELYKARGDYTRAEPLYKRALEIEKKSSGENHPDYAAGLNNLAGLYFAQGDYAKAEPLYRQALAINEKALGPNNPAVTTVKQKMAGLYRKLGRNKEADDLERVSPIPAGPR